MSNVEFYEIWAAIEHFVHIRHIRSIEMSNVEFCEIWAASEHIGHICHFRGIEMSNVEFCEIWAAFKHIGHNRHFRGIEMSNVEYCEIWTAFEHIGHIRHIRSIKILYAFYLRQIFEILEPRIATRRSCIGKRGLEYNLGNVIIVSFPFWLILATIECILIFAQSLLVSTTECQRAVSKFHKRAVIISLVTEVSAACLGIGLIAWFIWCPIDVTGERATIRKHASAGYHIISDKLVWYVNFLQHFAAKEHIVHIRHFSGIEISNIKRGEFIAHTKHIAHTRYIRSIEISNIKRGETFASIKHTGHILHVRCIEMCNIKRGETCATKHSEHIRYISGIEISNVKRGETFAILKHILHILHVRCIEMCNIEFCEFIARTKHISHTRYILGIKILYAFYFHQFGEIFEPRITTRRSCIGKRGFEYNFGNVFWVSVPCWRILATIECILIFAQSLLVSTTECQRAVSKFHKRAVIISLVTEVSAACLGIGLIGCFIWCPIDVTGERVTIWKHVFTFCHSSSFEFVWRIDSLQVGTVTEHSVHIRYFRSIEVREVERGKLLAMIKQWTHIRHIRCIQIFQTCNCFQLREGCKETA